VAHGRYGKDSSSMKPSTIEFAYIYVVYFLDPTLKPYEILHNFGMIVYTSLEDAITLVSKKTNERLSEVNNNTLWLGGNYWIERQPIIDPHQLGLEFEINTYAIPNKKKNGRLPLTFEDDTA
jgi:hypothetical protein